MTENDFHDVLTRYEFGPERVLKNIIAVDWSVEALMAYAKAHGQCCHLWTFTFKTVEDLDQCIADWGTFLRRLRAKTEVHGLRVFEWGRTTGRFHVHAVFDRFIDRALVNRLKADLTTMGHSKISDKASDENLGRYLWKELTKQFRQRKASGRRRLWGTFGRLAGFVTANDITVTTTEYWKGEAHEFWKEAKRNAWETRKTGESRSETWKRAWWLYWHHPRFDWGPEMLRWLAEHFPGCAEHGDAYEETGRGDVGFDPNEFESA